MVTEYYGIVPERGDFSIVANEILRNQLTFDYQYINSIGAWGLLCTERDLKSPFWSYIKSNCYPFHTDETFVMSMLIMDYIYRNSWIDFNIFVLNSLNNF
jgi:hypothetical protein